MPSAYTDPFELRRLVVKLTRAPTGGLFEDAALMTFHFAKLTAGVPDAAWLTADYTAVEGRFDTLWTAEKVRYRSTTALAEYRWFKSGPVFEPDDFATGPANPAVRITPRSVTGSSSATMLPPQCALTVTEKVAIRKRWGRFYLPAMHTTVIDNDGRCNATAAILASWVTFYNGCRTDGKQPVVFSRGRSSYVTGGGITIAAHVATAYEITELQVDNLFDVQRSRRYAAPTLRSATVLT